MDASNFPEVLDLVAAEIPDDEAIVFGDQRFTYKEVKQKATQVASGLIELGVKKDDKVAILLSNRPEWVFAQFGLLKAGAVLVPLNTRYKIYELEHVLRMSNTKVLITMKDFMGTDYYEILKTISPEIDKEKDGRIRSAKLPDLEKIICLEEKPAPHILEFNEFMENAPLHEEEINKRQAEIQPDDIEGIPFTSGTTGLPKGVLTTHEQYMREVHAMGERLTIRKGDRILAIPPFSFNLGNMVGLLVSVRFKCCLVPMEAFEPGKTLELIEKEKITHMTGTPTIFTTLLNHPDFPRYDYSSLRTALSGASSASPKLIVEVKEKMGFEVLLNGYGMTENSACTTMTFPDDTPEVISKTVGKPLPGVEVCIKDIETGEILPPGKEGEICTRGFLITKGYYGMPDEPIVDETGWFHTGDIGKLDEEGNLILTGRLKEMYINGGFNVYPVEVENMLAEHPEVAQAAVVGVPDERMGEVGAAFIIRKEGASCTEEEIRQFSKSKISNYKVPKYVEFVDELPLGPTGKIQKYLLLEEMKKKLA